MNIFFFLPIFTSDADFLYETIPFLAEINNFNTFDIVCLSAYFFSIHLTTTYCLVYRSDINNEVILHPYSPAHWHYSRAYIQHTRTLATRDYAVCRTPYTNAYNGSTLIWRAYLLVSVLIRWEDGFWLCERMNGSELEHTQCWHNTSVQGGDRTILLIFWTMFIVENSNQSK